MKAILEAVSKNVSKAHTKVCRKTHCIKEYQKAMFSSTFDGCPVKTFVFILQSNSPSKPAGEVILYFTDVFKRAQQQGRDILIRM